jgi:amino acid adenylation domain-containing protein
MPCIALDDDASYRGDGADIGRPFDPASPAYVLYTSGSTGQPKGVVVEHRALMNTLAFLEASYPLRGSAILLKTNFTFDVSATELFGWLVGNGIVAVVEPGAEKDPARLLGAIEAYGVTHINFVPSMLDALLAALHDRDLPTLERLEYVFVAGEALTPDVAARFHRMVRGVRLENLYGPTEAAIYATRYSVPRGVEPASMPIGSPISNTRVYVLDKDLRLVPVGVVGELCLAGAGLAREYLHQPALTAQRFCPDPYHPGETLYRTGDLAKWGDDGLIHYLGRSDGQVKIRGFRVELGEVQRKLLSCRGVAEAAVTVRTDRLGQRGLVAYLSRNGSPGSTEATRAEMAAWLPDYMVPEFFVELERLPRLASGKVDLQNLPEPEPKGPPAAFRRAPTELERTIIDIAEGLLNTTGLDPSSNFFRLGGNSLLTLRFIAALDAALGTRLSVIDFFDLPTIAEIAAVIAPAASSTSRLASSVEQHRAGCAAAPSHRS